MNFWKASTFVLTGCLALAIAVPRISVASAENQPRMQQALAALEQAKQHLEAATPDKGGHRVKALDATKVAIEETRKGIEFDNKH